MPFIMQTKLEHPMPRMPNKQPSFASQFVPSLRRLGGLPCNAVIRIYIYIHINAYNYIFIYVYMYDLFKLIA